MILREAAPIEAQACADIVNDWIDGSDWMPRLHSRESVHRFYRDVVFQERRVWVTGDPVAGFLALDDAEGIVTALYTAKPGSGTGKGLLDHAKAGRDRLALWTFVANEAARRFYAREGFEELRRTAGDNEEGLADVLLGWERS